MQTNEHSMLSLEEELTTIETDALEEERENAKRNFSLLESEEKSIMRDKSIMPFPDVREFDTGIDYSDISDLQYKKGQNKRGYAALKCLYHYLSSRRLFAGHCVYSDGHGFFITEDPELDSKIYFNGEQVYLINADDKRYADRVRMWQFPSEYRDVAISRTIHMQGRKVKEVDVRIDRSNQSATNIEDAFLRKALIRNKNKSGIESIIQTIQRKQDQIRLLPKDQSFIVQGCAGSGKTMVLLHRLRYLLYNREISSSEYLFLVPTNKFKLFIRDVCNEFRINFNNVVPVQTYYMTLAGERSTDESQDISELVFPPEYLKRVYSKEFMQDVIKALLQVFLEQADVLISSCDKTLSEIMETISKELKEAIKAEQDNAVALAPSIIERVQPYVKKTIKKYSDIDAILHKLEADYEKTEQKYKSIVEFDVSQLDKTKEIISRNPQLKKLQNDVKAAEARVKQWEKQDPENGRFVWDEGGVKDILQNPIYYGAIASQKRYHLFKHGDIGDKKPDEWIIVENCHEALVSKEDHIVVQEKMRSRTRPRMNGSFSLFSGLIKCGKCGKSLLYRKTNSVCQVPMKRKPRIASGSS